MSNTRWSLAFYHFFTMGKKVVTDVLLMLLILFSNVLSAQVYPVQATAQLAPPYSLYLADYVESGSERLALNVYLTDIARPALDVRLRLKIIGQGITLETKASYIPAPVSVQGGVPLRLISTDLAAYFNPNNLTFQGMSQRQYEQRGKLPEGLYQFCFEVLEYNRGLKISNTACATAWLILNDPPLINIPRQNEKLKAQSPQNVVMQWTPRHTGSPNSAFTTEYEIKMVEVWPSTRNPNDAILTSPPILETTTQQTTYVYGPSETPLEPGRRYAFRVKAKSIAGVEELDLFKNNGYSEVFTFVYGDACDLPTGINAEALSTSRFNIHWDALFNHTAFKVRYRPAGTLEWYETTSAINESVISSLNANTTYEYQVAASCGFYEGSYSPVAKITTMEEALEGFSCGLPMETFNLDPLQLVGSLKAGDVIKAGDFNVKLTKVSGSSGNFSGEGVIVVPYLNNASVKAEFTGITVNKELRMVNGFLNVTGAGIQVVPDGVLDLMDDLSEVLDQIDTALTTIEDNLPQQFDPDSFVADTLVNVKEGIHSIYKNDDGSVTIVDKKGNEQKLPPGTNYAVKDDAGNGYLVDSKGKIHKTTADVAAKAGNREYNLTLKFLQAPQAKNGFDEKQYDALSKEYESLPGNYNVPWKAVEKGLTDAVVARLEGSGIDKNKVRFELSGVQLQAPPFRSDQTSTLLIPGTTDEASDLLALYTPSDTAKDQVLGKLKVVTYDKIIKEVVLVPVNGASYTSDVNLLSQQLNSIYGQAVVTWNVSQAEGIQVSVPAPFDDGQSGLLSNYTADMKTVISAYKSVMQQDKYYLFLLNDPKTPNALGYMPRNKQSGFIFISSHGNDNNKLIQTIAHELGHGAFNLQHTFSEYSALSERSTDNLMDYGSGTRLYKYQWDKMRHNDIVIGLFEEDEDAEALSQFVYEDALDKQPPATLKTVWFYYYNNTRFVRIGFFADVTVQGNEITFNNEKYLLLHSAITKQFSGFYKKSDLAVASKTEIDGFTRYTITDAIGKLKVNTDYEILDQGELSSHTPQWLEELRKRDDLSKPKLDELAGLINKITNESLTEYLKNQEPQYDAICQGMVNIADQGRKYSEACWDQVIEKLRKLIEGSQGRCNAILALINKPDVKGVDKLEIIERFRALETIDYGVFSAPDRLRLLSYLVTGNMNGTFFGNENEEGFALKLIKYADSNQGDEIITGLEKVPVKLNDPGLKPEFTGSLMKNLSFKVDDGIWGIGGKHSKELTIKLVSLLSRSTTELAKRLDNAVPEVIFVQNSYFAPSDGEGMLQVYYKADGISKEISISQGRWVIKQSCHWVAESGGDGEEVCETTEKRVAWDPELRLNPFDLIVIAKESDLTLIEGIDPIRAESSAGGNVLAIPAIVVHYAHKEGGMRNLATYVGNTLDVVTLLVPFSKIASAPKWLNRFFKFTDVVSKTNSAANLTVNNTGLKDIPEVRELLETYNKFTLALNVANLTVGISRVAVNKFVAAAENRAAKQALQEAAESGNAQAKIILETADELKRYGTVKTGNGNWWRLTAAANNTVTTFKKLAANIKSSLDDAVFSSLNGKLDDQSHIWFGETGIPTMQTPKAFLNEAGSNMYDLVLDGKFYAKYDFNDGRILLADVDGKYYAFAQVVARPIIKVGENADDVIRAHIIDNVIRLKTLAGINSRMLTILGKNILTNPNKVNTFLGRFRPDVENLFNELGSFKNIGLGEMPGGINILNRPKTYESIGSWWTAHNQPWLKRAIERGDDIYLATLHTSKADVINLATKELKGAYAHELQYIVQQDYKPVNITDHEWSMIKSWFQP
jgi:hypothetical protein